MTRGTIFVVQSYTLTEGDELLADPPIQCPSAAQAKEIAAQMISGRAGVIAFSRTGDVGVGVYDPAEILFAAGRFPPEIE